MDLEILSTKDQLEEFKNSMIWKDFVNELELWKQGFTNELLSLSDNVAEENPSTANVLVHLGDLNGRIKAVNYLLGLPDMFINLIDTKTKEKKEDE